MTRAGTKLKLKIMASMTPTAVNTPKCRIGAMEDAGGSWTNISDGDFKTGTIGAIAVAESDPNVIYVGTGEAPIRGVTTSHGDGVYRSTDGGESWVNVGLATTRQISAIRVHPKNPDLVYVAAQGNPWGPNPERGVYRSKDGGESWERVLSVDETTGASDLSMDPHNPRMLFAAMWDHRRKPWEVRSGGPGSGIHRSTDGGDTWEKMTDGLPEKMAIRCSSMSRSNPTPTSGPTWRASQGYPDIRWRAWSSRRRYDEKLCG